MTNRLTELLGVDYPLILGPMRMITLGSMAAAVSNAGGFGQIASSMLTMPRLRDEIQKARNLTDKPFGVNIPLHRPTALEALEIVREEGVPAITTSGGNPAKIMDRVKALGIRVLHKVSTTDMGLKAQDAGVDGVIAMGFEAGGHVGKEQVTTLCLVPRLVDALDIPVIAAGGISEFRGFLAALALGAEGVEVGTRFLAAEECPISVYNKKAVLNAQETGTMMLGGEAMPMRVLRNHAAVSILSGGEKTKIFDYARPGGDAESTIMPAGQGVGLIHTIKPIRDIIAGFMDQSRILSTELQAFLKEGS